MEFTYERMIPGQYPALIENEHMTRYRFATQFVAGKQVADIACGTGYGTQLLAKAGAQSVRGVDLSEEAVKFSRENYSAPNVTFTAASAEKLTPIQDREFDLVVSFETIEHLPNVEAYLDEMVRILRPGGRFLVSTPDRRIASNLHCFRGRPSNSHHVREYTERELLDLLATRFEIEACYGQGFTARWLVFWPVQFFIKSFCRLLGTAGLRNFKDNLYAGGGNVEVTPKHLGRGKIPKFWVISCVRAAK